MIIVVIMIIAVCNIQQTWNYLFLIFNIHVVIAIDSICYIIFITLFID